MVQVVEWDEWFHKDEVLNLNHTYRHWSHKAKRVTACKDKGIVKGRTLGKHKHARLDVVVSYPILWKADASNWTPTMKAYVDGLVNVDPATHRGRGILSDDNDAMFRGPYLTGSGQRSGRKDWFLFHCKLTIE